MEVLMKIPDEFHNQLTSVAYRAGVSKVEAIMMGIELLERLVDADKQGKTFVTVDKDLGKKE